MFQLEMTSLRGSDDRRIRNANIIKRFKEGITPTQLAERFKLSMSQILHIIREYRQELQMRKELKMMRKNKHG